MLYRYSLFIFPLLTTLGCAGATSSPEPVTPEAGVSNSPVIPLIRSAEAWTIRSDPGPHTYTSVSNIVLELPSGSVTSRDSIGITSRYTLSFDRTGESVPVTGQVDQFLIIAGGRIGSMPQPEIPLLFSGSVTKHQVTINPVNQSQTAASTVCPNSWSTAFSGVRRNIFLVPLQVSSGMIWVDSTSSMTCHGSTPVSLKNIYTYKVIGEVDHQRGQALLVERTGVSSFSGQGSDGQHTVTVDGQGTSSGRFYLDRITGTVLTADDEQKTRVTIVTSGRSQIFAQTVNEQIALQGR